MGTTANLVITKPVSENDAQKVVTYNTAIDTLDNATAGILSLSVAGSGDVTLNNNQASYKTYIFTGALTGNINIKFPATGGSARQFIVFNNTTGAFTLTVKTTAGSSTGIAVTQTKKRLLWTDNTNVYDSITEGGGSITGAASDLSNLTGPTAVNTSLLPGTSDGAALGSTTKQWSDLFLAEGGVINWDNADATITQTGDVLAIAGASLGIGVTDPDYRLTVLQGVGGTFQGINIREIDTTNRRATLGLGVNTAATTGHIIGQSTGNNTVRDFYIYDYSTSTFKMIIDTSGNLGVGIGTFGTSAAKVLGLTNGTEPSSSPADMVQLFSVDLSAGNATLGIRTETAVVTESVTSDRTLSVRINGTTYKICLKA